MILDLEVRKRKPYQFLLHRLFFSVLESTRVKLFFALCRKPCQLQRKKLDDSVALKTANSLQLSEDLREAVPFAVSLVASAKHVTSETERIGGS